MEIIEEGKNFISQRLSMLDEKEKKERRRKQNREYYKKNYSFIECRVCRMNIRTTRLKNQKQKLFDAHNNTLEHKKKLEDLYDAVMIDLKLKTMENNIRQKILTELKSKNL